MKFINYSLINKYTLRERERREEREIVLGPVCLEIDTDFVLSALFFSHY